MTTFWERIRWVFRGPDSTIGSEEWDPALLECNCEGDPAAIYENGEALLFRCVTCGGILRLDQWGALTGHIEDIMNREELVRRLAEFFLSHGPHSFETSAAVKCRMCSRKALAEAEIAHEANCLVKLAREIVEVV